MLAEEATAHIAGLIDRFAASCGPFVGIASGDDEDYGAPPEMQVSPVDPAGWVEWSVRPSVVTAADLRAIEMDHRFAIPSHLQGYLRSRSHLFDQVHSREHGQLVLLTPVPTRRPLQPFARLLEGWEPLLRAGYVPFAEWGDGWGPVCIDIGEASAEVDDGPIVWFDHEVLFTLGEVLSRGEVSPHAIPLHPSFLAFLEDVFGISSPATPE